MVVKTITVTQEAYEKVKHLKHPDESFSEVLIRISEGKSDAVARFFGAAKMTAHELEVERRRIKQNKKASTTSFDKKLSRLKKRIKELNL